MIKWNKVTLKQAEVAVRNIRRKTPVLESLFDKVAGLCPSKNFNIHRKTPVLESSFNKVADLKVYNCIIKRFRYRCFPINMAKFLRPAFFIEHLRSLILNTHSFCMILPQFAL